MTRLDSVVEALHLWQLESLSSGGHLTVEDISCLAEDGELSVAEKNQLDHLSRCSLCMEEWVGWRQAHSRSVEESQVTHLGGYGFLQAAASGGHKPFKLVSSCNRYSIEVLPQEDEPTRAMMVFEVRGANISLENKIVTLRDRAGEVFLQGDLHGGQFARIVDDWDRFDLRKWTVFFRER